MTQRLADGVRTFRAVEFPRRRRQFKALASGQSPDTLFVTCSDSRIDPSLVTQTDPGDLFVIRNAGNLIPRFGSEPVGGEAATLEYAVLGLGVKDIVICGHSHCGAMAGLLAPDSLLGLPQVSAWLRHARTTLERVSAAPSDAPGEAAIETNVVVQLESLRSYPFVALREVRGDLTLHGWVYDFETGEVLELQPDGTFASLSDRPSIGNA
ncbi:MAG: carbonic anhydrase [Planctomycetes bacterium]|nr:carbonic anhydrase [Planctomycetota bacterium]